MTPETRKVAVRESRLKRSRETAKKGLTNEKKGKTRDVGKTRAGAGSIYKTGKHRED